MTLKFPRWHVECGIDGTIVAQTDLAESYDLDTLRAEAVADIKAEAQRRIGLVFGYPVDPGNPSTLTPLMVKELNLTARSSELGRILHDRAWTAEEEAEWDAGQALWDKVKLIRAVSNTVEAELSALTTQAGVFDYIETMPTDSRWPT